MSAVEEYRDGVHTDDWSDVVCKRLADAAIAELEAELAAYRIDNEDEHTRRVSAEAELDVLRDRRCDDCHFTHTCFIKQVGYCDGFYCSRWQPREGWRVKGERNAT